MEPTDDKTEATTEGAADEASKQQFLNALLAAGHESHPLDSDRETIEDDGVALSSDPDSVDLPGAPVGPVSARSLTTISPNQPQIMYSIERGPSNDDEKSVADETEATGAEDKKKSDEEDGLLLLSCPKCDGELALHEEHIGVEGSCVWCETPIVAGRTGVDRSVKVFAIATEDKASFESPSAEKPASDEEEMLPVSKEESGEVAQPDEPSGLLESDFPTGWDVPTLDEEQEVLSEPVEKPADTNRTEEPVEFSESDIASDWGTPTPVETEEVLIASEEQSSENAQPELPVEFSANDMPTGWGAPLQIDENSDATDTVASQDVPETPALSEVDTPPPAEGFGATLETAVTTETDDDVFKGFSSPSPDTENQPAAEAPSHSSGFGEFLSSASGSARVESKPEISPVDDKPAPEEAKSEGFSSPTPWGPPTQPVAEEPTSAASDETPDSTPAEDATPAGFSAPSGNDSAPEMAPADDFSAPSDWKKPATSSSEAPSEEPPSPSDGFGAIADFDKAPAPIAEEKAEAPSIPKSNPEPLFSATPPSQQQPDEAGGDFPVGFNIPSSEPSSSPFASFEPTDAAPASIDESTKSETPKVESLPIFEANEESVPAPLFDAPQQATSSLFGPAAESSDAPQTETPSNPFGEEKAEEKESQSTAEKSATTEPEPDKQKVDSVTLGKKKRGKGFFIISAIILGLVCGAALASFVLPVDEYVKSARSLMEQKFMPSATWEAAETSPPPAQPSPNLGN